MWTDGWHTLACWWLHLYKVASCADTGWTCFLSSLWYIWTHTWVTKKVYSALLFFFFLHLVSSSLCMLIHIKLHQRPTSTSLSNTQQTRSRYDWLAQSLPASRDQLYNRDQAASGIMMKWRHGLAGVLRFRCSCLTFMSTEKSVNGCVIRNLETPRVPIVSTF